jgi:hypothetical protein
MVRGSGRGRHAARTHPDRHPLPAGGRGRLGGGCRSPGDVARRDAGRRLGDIESGGRIPMDRCPCRLAPGRARPRRTCSSGWARTRGRHPAGDRRSSPGMAGPVNRWGWIWGASRLPNWARSCMFRDTPSPSGRSLCPSHLIHLPGRTSDAIAGNRAGRPLSGRIPIRRPGRASQNPLYVKFGGRIGHPFPADRQTPGPGRVGSPHPACKRVAVIVPEAGPTLGALVRSGTVTPGQFAGNPQLLRLSAAKATDSLASAGGALAGMTIRASPLKIPCASSSAALS